MADYTFGKLVTDQLVARNWSQRKLAERIGKSPTYINYVVRGANPSARDGKFQPGRDSVIKIAKALDIPIDEALLAAGYAPQSATTRPTSIPELVTALQSLGIEMPQLFGGLPDPNNEGFQEILDRIYEDVELVTNRMKRGTKRIGVIPLELAEDEPDVELRLSKQNPISKI